ncbi:hypothetical protein V1514DRAFT_307930 [Lipomyces japonicus]|uniref:uncharacterized protein n=1 Tax=Lipomyces japonicus TaxID=56871 RepID=UPI0034D00374
MDIDKSSAGIVDSNSSADDTDAENVSLDTPNSNILTGDTEPILISDDKNGDAVSALEVDASTLRADDYQAMLAKVCPALDDLEVREESYSVWQIDSWRKLEKRLHGPAFKLGGFEWKVLLFPSGNASDNVSMYLECGLVDKTAAEAEEQDWAVCAQFGLVMSNYKNSTVYSEHHASHRFTREEKDWGFTKFYDLRKLTTKHDDKNVPILEDDKVIITAYIKILKDPTGVLWHNFVNYNSKKETGYVGLRNQGATCYMNSLLQSLYFTKYFRKAVYQIPTENDEPIQSVPLALQRLFYQLQTSAVPVGTLELTRSFGWDTTDAFTQHDVQELNRVLMDNIEGKMKGTKAEGALTQLFVGQMKSFVKCINVDFESSRSEDFWDIQLNVKGMKTLHDSFKDYIQAETLNGENQYQATGYGLQDAEKGVIFQSFPPVLHLQLKRFDFDFMREMMVKINDRHEFPLEIDLQEFLSPEASRDESWIYDLHGVLVHSGDLNAGHYYALLKPEKNGDWYKFDDDRVTRATLKEVLDENYGEDPQVANQTSNQQFGGYQPIRQLSKFSLKRHSNAYMLVYLRRSRSDKVLEPLTDEDTPKHLPLRLEKELKEEEARRKEREEQHLYLSVKIMTNKQFRQYHGVDLGAWTEEAREEYPTEARPLALKLLKSTTLKELTELVAKEYGIHASFIRFWLMTSRQNKTLRPDIPFGENNLNKTLEDLLDKATVKVPDLRLWMEEASLVSGNPVFEADGNSNASKIFIFLKHFDPLQQSLTGVGHITVGRNDRIADIFKRITDIMNWPPSTLIDLFEEIQPTMVDPLKTKLTFSGAEIQDGDIICFQKRYLEHELSNVHSAHNAVAFYDFLKNRVQILFRPRNLQATINEEFELWFSMKDNYTQLTTKIASYLKCDPTHLRLTTTHISGTIKNVLKASTTINLGQMLHPAYSQMYSNVIYYEILSLSLSELETKKALKLIWLSDGISTETTYDILVPKSGIMSDVLQVLKEKANLTDRESMKVRFYGVHMNKIHRQYPEDYTVLSILDNTQLYAELLNDDDLDKTEDERYIEVYHFQKEPSRAHGTPFLFVLKPGEKFADTKVRLQKRTGLKDKQFEKVKFALVQKLHYSKPLYIEDEQVVYDIAERDDVIGLDHLDKTTYKTLRHEQRAIFIKN